MKRLLCTLLLIAPLAVVAAEMDDVEVKVERVAGPIHILYGRGGNIGLSVGADGVLMIDDQFAPLSAKIEKAVALLSEHPVKFLLNTHWHGDHTGGNEHFGKQAAVIAHHNVRERLMAEQTLFGRSVPPAAKGAWPVITFDEGLSIHFNGEEIKAIHLPHGHTDGDTVVHFTGSNVIHMGDLMFNGRFPFVDQNAGGNVFHYLENVAAIIEQAKADTKIIPGHGPLTDRAGLVKWHTELSAAVAAVKQAHAKGMDVAQAKAAKVLAPWDEMGMGFIKPDTFIADQDSELAVVP